MVELPIASIPDFVSIVLGLSVAVFFLFLKSKNRKANKYLALFLLSLTFEIIGVFFESITIDSLKWQMVFQSSLFTIPFLYFYVKTSVKESIKLLEFLLFVPGIIVNLIQIEFYNLIRVFEYFFGLGLLVYLLIILKNHKVKLLNYYTELEKKTLSWIKLIIYIFLLFHAVWIAEDILIEKIPLIDAIFPTLSTILTIITIYIVAFYGFSQAEIFKDKQFCNRIHKEENATSKESNPQFVEIVDKIKNEKIYLIQDLNLSILASKLEMKDKDLSGLINSESGTNFYHFINNFRLQEFKRLMETSKIEQLNILGLAQESGFKSKTSFYEFFKKVEGKTPNQYKQEIRK